MSTPSILMISPSGPPQNTAESIQVRRLLAALDQQTSGIWVTEKAYSQGWSAREESLMLPLQHFQKYELALPFDNLFRRVFTSHYAGVLHQPDSSSWIRVFDAHLARLFKNKRVPDVIYARCYPFSSAMLAHNVARRLNRPWVMHLSDPWFQNDSSPQTSKRRKMEAHCVEQASLISLTTQGKVEYYQRRYPEHANKFFVSPNMYPAEDELADIKADSPAPDAPLRIVHTGALYSMRSPRTVIDAVHLIAQEQPDLLQHLRIEFYGNAVEESLQQLKSAPANVVRYGGLVAARQAKEILKAADVALTIDFKSDLPIHQHYLPSKVLEALALQKPMLCLTAEKSAISALCQQGYGWAIASSDTRALANCFKKLVETRASLRAREPLALPPEYHAENVASTLLEQMAQLMRNRA